MVGEFDGDWLPGTELFRQNLPSVEVVTLANAEHHPHQENPSEFLLALEAHLSRVGEADRDRSDASLT
jgi:pimeloyl-ACP methyl ester carboxylesterase